MAKKSQTAETVLLLLALVIPLGGASFLLNLVLTVVYLPSVRELVSVDAETAIRIFFPFVMYLIALAFSIVVLTGKPKDKMLTLVALVLNSILVVSGMIYLASVYFV